MFLRDVAQGERRDLVQGLGVWREVTRRDAQGKVADTVPLSAEEGERLDADLRQRHDRAWELVKAVLVMRATGQTPWTFGQRLSRARVYEAAALLAPALTIAPQLWQVAAIKQGGGGCPLLSGN